jgi:hypothetical protein
MGHKLLVALQLEDAHHFIERCASGPTSGCEPPATFGTTKTPETLLVNPHQLPAHGLLCRCVATVSGRMPDGLSPSADKTFRFAITSAVSTSNGLFLSEKHKLLVSPMVARNA